MRTSWKLMELRATWNYSFLDKSGASITIPTTRTSLCSILAPREVGLRSLAPLVAVGLAVARQKMLQTAVRRGGRIHQGTWRPPLFKDGSSHLIMFLRSLVVFSGTFIIHDRSNFWSPLVTVGLFHWFPVVASFQRQAPHFGAHGGWPLASVKCCAPCRSEIVASAVGPTMGHS